MYSTYYRNQCSQRTMVEGVGVRNVAMEEGTRPDTFFFHVEDGYHYHLNRESEGVKYFKCVLYERGCQGRAVFDNVDGFIHTQRHSIHGADPVYPEEMALRRAILARCRALEYTGWRTIIDEECRRYVVPVIASKGQMWLCFHVIIL